MKIKKLVFSFVIILTFVVYVVYQRKGDNRQADIIVPSVPTTAVNPSQNSAGTFELVVPASPSSPPTTQNPSAAQQQAPVPTPAPAPAQNPAPIAQPTTPSGTYRDGTYTGSVADAYYGNVQVKATISGGKITDVTFLQHPGDRRTSILINSQAMPILSQEAIQVQSANVDAVSGASDTSQAFQQSLAYALSQAKN